MSRRRSGPREFPETTELKPNRLDLPPQMSAAALLVAASVLAVVLATDLWRLAGVLVLLLSVAYATVLLLRALRERPVLRLTALGLLDHASGVRAGFVPWAEVVQAVPLSVVGRDLVGVVVATPRALLEQVPPARRGLARINLENLRPATPLWIDTAGLMPADELAHLINTYHAGWIASQHH